MAAKIALSSSYITTKIHLLPKLPSTSAPHIHYLPRTSTNSHFRINAKLGGDDAEAEQKKSGKRKFITKEQEPEHNSASTSSQQQSVRANKVGGSSQQQSQAPLTDDAAASLVGVSATQVQQILDILKNNKFHDLVKEKSGVHEHLQFGVLKDVCSDDEGWGAAHEEPGVQHQQPVAQHRLEGAGDAAQPQDNADQPAATPADGGRECGSDGQQPGTEQQRQCHEGRFGFLTIFLTSSALILCPVILCRLKSYEQKSTRREQSCTRSTEKENVARFEEEKMSKHKRQQNENHRSPEILLSDSESVDHTTSSEDSENDSMFRENLSHSTNYSDGSISDEESLIEIALPTGHYVDSKRSQEPSWYGFQHQKWSSDCSLKSHFRQQNWMEMLNEMNEENFIEIDLCMGSIKCSRFEIQA
uniref:Uncharacterized protein n=1 Tax=Chenopodium quinoa TaxID=63459 RepID=A0A803MGL5_CHEQI